MMESEKKKTKENCLRNLAQDMLMHFVKHGNEKNEDGMPESKRIETKIGGDTLYLRYDAVVRYINTKVRQMV